MFSSKNDKIEKVDKILTNEAFEELQVDFRSEEHTSELQSPT